MLGSPIGHKALFDAYGKRTGYISSGLDVPENIERIVHAFGLENAGYRIVYDEHYQFNPTHLSKQICRENHSAVADN